MGTRWNVATQKADMGLIMIVAIKAVLDLMAKSRPLPLYSNPFSIDDSNGGIRCPNVAYAFDHLGTAHGVLRGIFSEFDAVSRGIQGAMPLDGDSGLQCGAAGHDEAENNGE